MRILLLADINSAHTQKWINALLKEESISAALFSLSKSDQDYDFLRNIDFATLGISPKKFKGPKVKKLVYLKAVPQVREFIKSFKPDIIHAHYATSYGLLGGATKFHPFLISIWGSDIQSFPQRSPLHNWVISSILKKADHLLTTSHALQTDLKHRFGMDSDRIPFGIDINQFTPKTNHNKQKKLVFGTVKALEEVYGIDILIRAFAQFRALFPSEPSTLLIFGKGSKEAELKTLAKELEVEEDIDFRGYVQSSAVQNAYYEIDVFIALSRRESFGVSVLEASACGLPVIVSKAKGFSEVCRNEETGLQVNRDNMDEIIDAMKTYRNAELREAHGNAGVEWVQKEFNLKENTRELIKVYTKVLSSSNKGDL